MTRQATLKCAGIGAGYFSHYHYEAWHRIPEVDLVAIVDRDLGRAEEVSKKFGVAGHFASYEEMLDAEKPDFVDIITPPESHAAICHAAFDRRLDVICQKPLAPSYAESLAIVEAAREAGVGFMVHEDWRWQPWYREINRLIDDDVLGEIFSAHFSMRTGDGWGDDAYVDRQPFFRDYPRLLVYETGIHFIDTFRYLFGEIESVYARLRRLNPVIKGEDSGQVVFGFENGVTAIWDGNRYNESEAEDPRFTFGVLRIDGRNGHLNMDSRGNIYVKLLGSPIYQHDYVVPDSGFAGDCVYSLQRHFVDYILGESPLQASGEDYLKSVRVVDACYASADAGEVVRL